MFISCMSINVSPHSGLAAVAMFSTATATLTFWRSVSKSACVFLHFSVSLSRRVARSFLPSAHTPMLPAVSLLNCTIQGTATSLHQILSQSPSVQCCCTQYLFTYFLFLASWMMLPKPHKMPHQLIEWLVNNTSEMM